LEKELEEYFDRLWPICRSITGAGLRDSFKILQDVIPLELHEIATGDRVFDWEVPKEWNINSAYLIAPDGRKIADFSVNNLHLVNYSIPQNTEIEWEELKPHLHYLKEQPNAIPYLTTYYKETWGFCMSYEDYLTLPKTGKYQVIINSSLKAGSLTYGEVLLPGSSNKEILISSYLCHPSMANNELSGPLATAFLYKKLAQLKERKYSYRFVVAPETIGVICFLNKRGEHLKRHMKAGYVLTCCGDGGKLNFKRSKNRHDEVNVIAEHILTYESQEHSVRGFSVGGSDERQYCSPGFNLPVGSFMRTPYQEYREYHTSLDNKEFIDFKALSNTVNIVYNVCNAFEVNSKPFCHIQECEPQLGKRGLYPSSFNPEENRTLIHRRMHLLTYSDGKHSLLEIAELRNESILEYTEEIKLLLSKKMITIR
tara:strand:- start:6795 stop:8072 length:1278 start_codon:yes stop_codon:yes gene_type:complete